jgi:two-component system, OmpR family, alkaline phosphatase synthesis response regulator PhoP
MTSAAADVLVVDDDPQLREALTRALQLDGYDVATASNGAQALEAVSNHRPDLMVLDVMMPYVGGLDVCRTLRQRRDKLPILVLTARDEIGDRVAGLDAGADDYLTKPFELPIFMSRVRGLLRRHEWFRLQAASRPSPPHEYAFRGKVIDFEQLEVRVGEKRMPLTLMEAALLRYFVENEGKPVARKTILDRVWNVHEDTDTRAIDNFVVRLRRYIEDEPARPRHLQTVRGVGYRFVSAPE